MSFNFHAEEVHLSAEEMWWRRCDLSRALSWEKSLDRVRLNVRPLTIQFFAARQQVPNGLLAISCSSASIIDGVLAFESSSGKNQSLLRVVCIAIRSKVLAEHADRKV